MIPNPCLASLLALLQSEAEAVITGQYAVIDSLAGRKLALFQQLGQAQATSDDLRLLRDALARNQSLFAAAIRGANAAKDRLADLRKVRAGLQVYDPSGQLTIAPQTRPDMVRKA